MVERGHKRGLRGALPADGVFPKLPERMRRPAVFALLFWSVLVLSCVSYAMRLNGEDRTFGLAPVVVVAAALVMLWSALPWDPRAGRLRKLAVPGFLLCLLGFAYLTKSAWALGLYAVPLANGVFVFGFGRGIAYAAAVLPVIFVNYVLVLTTLYPQREAAAWQALLLTICWIPVAAFMIGICVAIVEAVRRREEARELLAELESAHAELRHHAERTRELALSEERARMAREMHDSVGHHLTAINLKLENAERFKERDPRRSWARVREAKDLALSALSEVKRSVRALRPPALEESSGAGALAALARGFDGTDFEVGFAVQGKEVSLPEEAELVLYRAMQEGLANAARHSGARRVLATLAFRGESVRLTVADDGRGIGDGELERGFGLSGLRERVETLGGKLSAENLSGGGFALAVELPSGSG